MIDVIISDDKSKFPVEKAIELLHTTYWAENRDSEVIRKSIDNSIVFVTRDAHGLYEHFGFKRDTERAMTRRL